MTVQRKLRSGVSKPSDRSWIQIKQKLDQRTVVIALARVDQDLHERALVNESCKKSNFKPKFPPTVKMHSNIKNNNVCSVCGKTIKRACEMERHMRVHTREKQFKCSVCSKCFTSSSNLSTHKKTIHGSLTNNYTCIFCNRKFKTKFILKSHTYTHTQEKPFGCLECPLSFKLKYDLKAHIVRIHRKGPKTKSCEICQKCFYTESELKKHKKQHLTQSQRKGDYMNCQFCEKQYLSPTALAEHVKGHTGERVRHQCSHCSSSYLSMSNLRHHITLNHTYPGLKPFKCDKCPSEFAWKPAFQSHIQQKHLQTTSMECSYCHKIFYSKHILHGHVRTVHTHFHLRPHACSFCSKAFSAPCKLRMHMLVHTGEKPLSCELCNSRFTTRRNLKTHVSRFHPEKAGLHEEASQRQRRIKKQKYIYQSRNLPCNICNKLFASKESLKMHGRRIHNLRGKISLSDCNGMQSLPKQTFKSEKT